MEKIKWGILGPGLIADTFVSDFSKVNNGEVVAIGSRSKERAEKLAKKYGVGTSYGSYSELLNDKSIDIIYIGTPHNFHYEQTKLCLEHGKHVLCEKPITVNAKESQELFNLAKSKNLFLMEVMWTPFLPAV